MDEVSKVPIQLDDLCTVDELAGKYPKLLTARAIRWQLRDREKNGLSLACVRVGKRLLISCKRYESWLATRAGA